MLKGKKKALAVQVLLGLMVAGNVYTVDCGVASADTYEVGYFEGAIDSTHKKNYSGWANGDVVVLGKSGTSVAWFTTDSANIIGHNLVYRAEGQAILMQGANVIGNTVTLGDPYWNDEGKGKRFMMPTIFDASGECYGNVVNVYNANLVKWGKICAGDGNTVNIYSTSIVQKDPSDDDTEIASAAEGTTYDVTAGNINIIGDGVGCDAFKAVAVSDINVKGNDVVVGLLQTTGTNSNISIVGDNLTATDVNSTGNVNVYGSNANVTNSLTADTLNINGNGSLKTKNLDGVNKVVIDASASTNALTLTGDSVDEGKVRLSNAVDANSSALFVKTAALNISGGNVKLNKTITGTREQSKSLVETQMASMALANGSADLVAGAGYTNAAQAVKEAKESGNAASAMVPYAAANYGSMRQESGSYVDVDSANFNIGFAKEVKNSNGKLLFGPMVEYGRGNYESHLDDGTVGTGNGQSFGVGVMARQTNDNGFYYEGSLRYGKSTSTYSSNNLVAGKTISYDNSANYWGAHAGVGKVVKLSGDNSIDMYGKLFYTRQGASSVNVDGDTLDFSAVSSKRSRIGFRYIHGTSQVRSIYAGLAWQHEFDGSAHATANGFSTPSPSVKGDSGMLELGVLIAPKASPVSFDLGVSGWAGKQKGYSLNANMCWSF